VSSRNWHTLTTGAKPKLENQKLWPEGLHSSKSRHQHQRRRFRFSRRMGTFGGHGHAKLMKSHWKSHNSYWSHSHRPQGIIKVVCSALVKHRAKLEQNARSAG